MALIVIFALLVALGLLANRYGYDSRARLHSEEERMAATGVTWGAPTVEPRWHDDADQRDAA